MLKIERKTRSNAPAYYVRQCVLTAVTDRGTAEKVCWLPERCAKPGKRLRLKRSDGTHGPWFTVQEAGDTRLPVEYAEDLARLHKRVRRHSDI